MRISGIISSSLIFIAAGTAAFAQYAPGYEKGLSTIKATEIQKHISFLASDSLKGRESGSAEELSAAKFIASRFSQYGLKSFIPANRKKGEKQVIKNEAEDQFGLEPPTETEGELEMYMEKFSFKKYRLQKASSLIVSEKNGSSEISREYKIAGDFVSQHTPPNDLRLNAPVVFAGFGIDKGEDGYSDYKDAKGNELDVKNKIVVIVDGTPLDYDSLSIFSKSKNLLYKNVLRKADLAMEKGAAALVVINSPYKKDPPAVIKNKYLADLDKWEYTLGITPRREIPVFYINNNIVHALFGSTKKLKDILDGINSTLKPASFEMPEFTITCDIRNTIESINTQNVIGIVEGTDPVLKEEVIVIGAHYDHIGLGHFGVMDKKNENKIHYGADDNASGTCGLLELAEAFAKTPARRTIVFAAFTGEEHGMIGSRYYAYEMPAFPMKKTTAMFNMDMIGRNDIRSLYVGGAFYSPDLIKIVEKANEKTGFTLLYNTGLLGQASDHAMFGQHKIPYLFYFGGFHEDYHTPEDKVSKINTAKIEKVAKLAYLTAWLTANDDAKPAYCPTTMEQRTKLIKESIIKSKQFENN